jgi:hypothetical protein
VRELFLTRTQYLIPQTGGGYDALVTLLLIAERFVLFLMSRPVIASTVLGEEQIVFVAGVPTPRCRSIRVSDPLVREGLSRRF